MTGSSPYTDHPEPVPAVPEPEVRSTVLHEKNWPRGLKTIANLARKQGFDVEVTYARGSVAHGNQVGVFTLKHSLNLRITKDGKPAAVAFWYAKADVDHADAEYSTGGAIVPGLGKLKSDDLKHWLKHGTDPRPGGDADPATIRANDRKATP